VITFSRDDREKYAFGLSYSATCQLHTSGQLQFQQSPGRRSSIARRHCPEIIHLTAHRSFWSSAAAAAAAATDSGQTMRGLRPLCHAYNRRPPESKRSFILPPAPAVTPLDTRAGCGDCNSGPAGRQISGSRAPTWTPPYAKNETNLPGLRRWINAADRCLTARSADRL